MSRSTKRTFYKQFNTGQDVKGDFLPKCFIESSALELLAWDCLLDAVYVLLITYL